jgi:hypothetical protein
MSDRARSSVRTDSRQGDEASDGVEAATPAGGGGSPAAEPERAVEQTQAASRPEKPRSAPSTPTPTPASDGTQVITPDSPPSGVFAGSSAASPAAAAVPAPAADGPVRSAPPAAAGGRSAAPGSGSAAGRPAASRGQVPAGPMTPIGPDGTQAVPLPSAGARPAGAPGRPSAPPVNAPAGAPAAAGEGRARGRGRGMARGPRRARLQLRHIDTWSALKISLVVAIAMFFVWMVAVGVLYGVLNGLGVFTTLNDLFGQLSSSSGGSGASKPVITARIVFGGAAVIGLVNAVLLTALSTIGAVVYNLCSDLVGGLEVTLAERE